jgi:peptidoglycan/xylan/chitin deacetylase (PgdA/CDA1 family)
VAGILGNPAGLASGESRFPPQSRRAILESALEWGPFHGKQGQRFTNPMKIYQLLASIATLAFTGLAHADAAPEKIAIIKADDIRGSTEKWNRFFALSKEKGVKVSAGIICQSLEEGTPGYFAWLEKLQASGDVEFWNHGWDHKRWTTEDGKELREFAGTGYEHQKKHFDQSQTLMEKVLGVAPVAFGAPFNSIDADTVRVMGEDPAMRLVFCNSHQRVTNKLVAPMHLRGESDGTAKPNFEKFKAEYSKAKNRSFSAIQFHPGNFSDGHFEEYAKILDFLIAEGWKFVLPSEYVAKQAQG